MKQGFLRKNPSREDLCKTQRVKTSKQITLNGSSLLNQNSQSSFNDTSKSFASRNSKRGLYTERSAAAQQSQTMKSPKVSSQYSQSFVQSQHNDTKNSSAINVTPKRTTQYIQLTINPRQQPSINEASKNYQYNNNSSNCVNTLGLRSSACPGTISVNRRYIETTSSQQSNSKIESSGKNTELITSLEITPRDQYKQKTGRHNNLKVKQGDDDYDECNTRSAKDDILRLHDLAIPESSSYNTLESKKDKQVFSFSKTPKFGSVAPGVKQNAFQKICDQYESLRNQFSSVSSNEINDELQNECTSNDERVPIGRQGGEIHNQMHMLYNMYMDQQSQCLSYSNNQDTKNYNQIFSVRSNDSLNRESITFSLTQSQAASNKLSINTFHPNESPRDTITATYNTSDFNHCNKRSKTPTVQSSTANFIYSFDKEKSHFEKEKQSVVRPTATIKNPFTTFDYSQLNVKQSQSKLRNNFNSQGVMNRCETEAGKLKKQAFQDQEIKVFQNFFSHDNDTKLINLEQDDSSQSAVNYEVLFKEEYQKHESTKRALNKAIQLANLLIDEIQGQNSKMCFKSKKQQENKEHQENQSLIFNSNTSFTQSRFHTPEPNTIYNKFNARPDLKSTVISQNIRDYDEIEQNETLRRKRELSRKKSLKASTKELQDLTNLIRKTKNSPHIINAKSGGGQISRFTSTPITGLGYSKTNNNISSLMQSGDNFSMINSRYMDQTTISTNLKELMSKISNLKTCGADRQDLSNKDGGHQMMMEDDSFGSQSQKNNIKLMSIKKISRSLFKDIHEYQ
ncbi:UNKNOWN [Stylonychia lemnae]|uniref:Uncharacterized protein n=1 Tax=Stylonychia lemnae TaxID=5949 RepID=A0A078AWL5_STYLE|nr:UNKNOWN [Stylonychia lemnae]|eukprot:CDW85198.1 UNKNOWN [Stylonychia lemnae]